MSIPLLSHLAFVIAAVVMIGTGWRAIPETASSNFSVEMSLLNLTNQLVSPTIEVTVIFAESVGDETWHNFSRNIKETGDVVLFTREATLGEVPCTPQDITIAAKLITSTAFELLVSCMPPGNSSQLVVGPHRRSWAFVYCGVDGVGGELADLGRMFASVVLWPKLLYQGGRRFCISLNATHAEQEAHFALAVEGRYTPWNFGVAAGCINPILRQLWSVIRLRVTSSSNAIAPLLSTPVQGVASSRSISSSNLGETLMNDGVAPSILTTRNRAWLPKKLIYFVALLPLEPLTVDSSPSIVDSNIFGIRKEELVTVQVGAGGGVFILPVNSSGVDGVTFKSMGSLSTAFVHWLRGSLGLDPDMNNESCSGLSCSGRITCTVLRPITGLGFRDWEVDAIAREALSRWQVSLLDQVAALRSLLEDGTVTTDAIESSVTWEHLSRALQFALNASQSRSSCSPAPLSLNATLFAIALGSDLVSELVSYVTLYRGDADFPLEHLAAVYLPMWMPLVMPLFIPLLYEIPLAIFFAMRARTRIFSPSFTF